MKRLVERSFSRLAGFETSVESRMIDGTPKLIVRRGNRPHVEEMGHEEGQRRRVDLSDETFVKPLALS